MQLFHFTSLICSQDHFEFTTNKNAALNAFLCSLHAPVTLRFCNSPLSFRRTVSVAAVQSSYDLLKVMKTKIKKRESSWGQITRHGAWRRLLSPDPPSSKKLKLYLKRWCRMQLRWITSSSLLLLFWKLLTEKTAGIFLTEQIPSQIKLLTPD